MAHRPFQLLKPTQQKAVLHKFRRDRLKRELDKAFAALITDPHDFGTIAADNTSVEDMTMPAGARLALALSVSIDAEDIAINVTGGGHPSFTHPDLDADEIHRGDWAEENRVVSVTREAGCPAGDFTLYQVDAQSIYRIIGTATFSA